MTYVAPKRSTDLLATKIRPKRHHILVLLSALFTIFRCNLLLITVQLRTKFCSQQISDSFWCNKGQNFLECSSSILHTGTEAEHSNHSAKKKHLCLYKQKCIDVRFNFVITDKKNHKWVVKTRLSFVFPHFKFEEIQNDYLTQILIFSAEVELKKIHSCWRRSNKLIYFLESKFL